MPKQAAKCRQPQPKRALYTPEPVRGRVIARHVAGQSNREIATDERIDRATVSRILSQREVVHMIAQYQARLLSMVPKAISVYDDALASDDERVRVAAATKLLEGLQVLHRGGIDQTVDIANRAATDLDIKNRRRIVMGELMEMMIEKKQRYGTPLPPEFDGLEKELTKRFEASLD